MSKQTSISASAKRAGKICSRQSTSKLSFLLSSGCPHFPSIVIALMAVLLSVVLYYHHPVVLTGIKQWLSNEDLQDVLSHSSGWKLPEKEVLLKYGSDICTIERLSVSDLSPERFEADFRLKKPVLVTFTNGATDWTEPRKWSRHELSRTYSKRTIHSGQSLEIVRKGGNAEHESSFQDYLTYFMGDLNTTSDPTNYVFDRKFYGLSNLPKTLHLPKYFQINMSEDESIFFLGPSMTGVVFHKHSDTWNGVVFGSKRWFLYSNTKTPPGGVHHGFSLLEWFRTVYPALTEADKPRECIQHAGEILYLPEGTYHATLNLGDTIAVAIQKKNPRTEAEKLSYEATRLTNLLQDPSRKNDQVAHNSKLLEIYRKWLQLLPESSEAVMKIGDVLYNMGDYSESLSWHKKAIQMDPYFVMAYIHLGKTFSALREYQKAETSFRKALEISPNLWDTYKEYGEFLLKQGRHADALPVFRKGTELMPEMIPFWFYYKLCQIQMGDQTGAEASDKIIDDLKHKRKLDSK